MTRALPDLATRRPAASDANAYHPDSATNGARPAWFACYTRPRSEKKVDELFRRRGIESYLPLAPRVRQWHDRRKVVHFPLFPSYVFARFASSAMTWVLATPGMSEVVRFGRRPAAIPDEEIENIARFVHALGETAIEPPPAEFSEGERVRIVSGPFRGVVGRVLEVRGVARVLIGLEAIRMGFGIDVPTKDLEKLEPNGIASPHPSSRQNTASLCAYKHCNESGPHGDYGSNVTRGC